MALWTRRDLYRSAGIGGQGIVYQFLAALTASHRSDTHTALLASIRRHGTPLVRGCIAKTSRSAPNLSRPTTRVNRHIERSDHRRARYDSVAAMPESYRAIIEGRPAWVTGAFAIAVFGGALGSLLLLLRKSAAYYLFIASLLGAIAQIPSSLATAGSTIGVGAFLLVAALLIWYSKQAKSNGWIS